MVYVCLPAALGLCGVLIVPGLLPFSVCPLPLPVPHPLHFGSVSNSSLNSVNSSDSRSSGSHSHSPSPHYRYRSSTLPQQAPARLSSISSHDSGFISQDAFQSKSPSPMPSESAPQVRQCSRNVLISKSIVYKRQSRWQEILRLIIKRPSPPTC